jgi:hypothetical protein
MARITLIPLPRLSGSTEEQLGQIYQYQQQTYSMVAAIARALAEIRALGPLALDVSNPPTQAEVREIAAKIDDMIVRLPEVV